MLLIASECRDINASGVHTVKRFQSVFARALLIAFGLYASAAGGQTARWTEQKANAWYAQQPWLVGSNYVPKSAINQLEMWQAATFDPDQIDKELSWAESMGMNTIARLPQHLPLATEGSGFRKRIDQFLTIASRHHVRPL